MAMDTGFEDENKGCRKYKPGDKVRISKNPERPLDPPSFVSDMDVLKGKIVTLRFESDADKCWRIEGINYNWHERWFEDIEPEEPEEAQTDKKHTRDLIIHCPTKELWVKVVRKLFNEGYIWMMGDKIIHEEHWDNYKGESCVALFKVDNKRICYQDRPYWQERFSSISITPAEEFLGKEERKEVLVKKELDAQTSFKEICAEQEADSGQQTAAIIKQILLRYYNKYLSKESEEYPLLDIRKAVLREKLLSEEELVALLAPVGARSFRKAAKNLGVFLYQTVAGKSEYTDISFCLDGYPPICKFSLKTSSFLNEIIENLANGKYRDIQKLKDDIQKLEEKTEGIKDSMNDNLLNSKDAPLDSIPRYEYLGGGVYTSKDKQHLKPASVPEWIVYQGVMVKNPDFVPPTKPLGPSNSFVPPESSTPDKVFDFALAKKQPKKPYKLKKSPEPDIFKQ